jgi:SAM-dependent methyltransferase
LTSCSRKPHPSPFPAGISPPWRDAGARTPPSGITAGWCWNTGGGEFLAGLLKDAALPQLTCATEGYPPNLPVAKARLEPLCVRVTQHISDDELPFEDAQFDLVINRHESYSPREVRRILKLGGTFLTQQVGASDCIRLNELLQENAHLSYAHWTLDFARRELEAAGMYVTLAQEEFPRTWFKDIGAVVYYLKVIPWQIPEFDLPSFRSRLFSMDQVMQTEGGLHLTSHRFILIARNGS